MDMNRRTIRTILGFIAFGVVMLAAAWNLGAVWAALKFVFSLFSFFIMGLCFAFIFNTPLQVIENKMFAWPNKHWGRLWLRLRRPISLVLTMVFVLGVLFLVVFMVIPEMGRTFVVIGDELPVFYEEITTWLQTMQQESGRSLGSLNLPELDWVKIGDAILDLFRNGAGDIVTNTVAAATTVVSGVTNVVIGIILAVYILWQKERLADQGKRVLYAYLPDKRVDRMLEIGGLASHTFGNFITGQFLEAVILGSLCFLGMRIFNFPFAPMVSVLVGVTACIPLIGAFIGFVIGAFMILVHQGAMTALWFCIFFVSLQQVEGNLIYPYVVGKRMMLPGLWVITATMLGGNLAGILGILISVPLASLLYTLLKEAVNHRNGQVGT